MSAETRPRRTARATAKAPVEFTPAGSRFRPSDGANVPYDTKANGKRNAPTEDGDEEIIFGNSKRQGEQSEPVTKTSSTTRGRDQNSNLKKTEEMHYSIDFILTNPKSSLVNMDISDVLNYGVWTTLSPESRARLSKLLPAQSFGNQHNELDELHPSRRRLGNETSVPPVDGLQMKKLAPMRAEASNSPQSEERLLDPTFFKDPHFESAARTFQDHLYSGWFRPAHQELVEKHLSGVRDGALHAPWKDDLWDRDHPESNEELLRVDDAVRDPSDSIGIRSEGHRGKESKTSEFDPLVRKGFLKQGDIIALKHKFSSLGITIEKDALISAIHPKTSVLTLMVSSGTSRGLPPTLLVPFPNGSSDLGSLREMTVSTPMHLIAALLDIDGRIPRGQRPRLDTWKLLSVWQWPLDSGLQDISVEESVLLERGGRVSLGTLFYLRGQALDD